MIGTPDGAPNRKTCKPKAYYASLVHDALYQFLDAGLPMTRLEADRIFLEILAAHGFRPRRLYYHGVRLFGGIWRRLTCWKRNYRYGKRLNF